MGKARGHRSKMKSTWLWLLATTANLVGVAKAVGEGFYPPNHFDYVTQITGEDHLNSFVEEQLAADKTVFVRWIASEG